MTINEKILSVAKKYIGKRELTGNSGFVDADFEKRMSQVGWSKSMAWCSFFAELVWKEAHQDNLEMVKLIDKLFSASATATYKNFNESGLFVVSKTPVIGSLAVWRYGTNWKGHIGITSKIFGEMFYCIEGNTNDDGGREGNQVAERLRSIDYSIKENRLNLLGFIHPK